MRGEPEQQRTREAPLRGLCLLSAAVADYRCWSLMCELPCQTAGWWTSIVHAGCWLRFVSSWHCRCRRRTCLRQCRWAAWGTRRAGQALARPGGGLCVQVGRMGDPACGAGTTAGQGVAA